MLNIHIFLFWIILENVLESLQIVIYSMPLLSTKALVMKSIQNVGSRFASESFGFNF